jgi:mevalonate kinase
LNFGNTIYQRFARGKLLLTGEYLVLNGAKAIALPSHFGQSLEAVPHPESTVLQWSAFDADGTCWLEARFEVKDQCRLIQSSIGDPTHLAKVLSSILQLNPAFSFQHGWNVKTTLTFNKAWGLGTSSTLIALLADWTATDPLQLLNASFGGSGYDVACAFAESPIWYQRTSRGAIVEPFPWKPKFCDSLFFVYLGHKKDSREAMSSYKTRATPDERVIASVERIGNELLAARDQQAFNLLLEEHEQLIAGVLGETPVKQHFFADFPGAIKSLGAWGGDFVLASPQDPAMDVLSWMNHRGYSTVIPWQDLVL